MAIHSANKNLAFKLNITPVKLNGYCNKYYAIWFLREVYFYGQLPSERKQLIQETMYNIIEKKAFNTISNLYILTPELAMADWLFTFHTNYYTRSPHYIKGSNYVD